MTRMPNIPARVGIFLLPALFVVFLAAPHRLLAQSTANLTGTVTDSSGAVVTGAAVLCTNSGTGLTYNAVTNEEGLFRFPDLPIGVYELTISHSGFTSSDQRGIVLATGHNVDVPVRLAIGQAKQSIEVTDHSQEVQPTSSEIQTSIENTSMQELPLNGRNPLQLLALAPGTIYSAGAPSFQTANSVVEVNGGRGTDNGYLLDGVDYIDEQYQTAPVLPSPDALQEFTAKTSNFSATEGGAGANVEFTTRSGTNQIHGSAFEFVRNNDTDARNYFGTGPTPFKRNQFGGAIGGPIFKDRTFYFASYQGTRTVGGASPAVAVVPSAAYRSGNFSGGTNPIIDPVTGTQFPGNIIPTSRFDSYTLAYLNYYPVASQSNGTFTSLPRTNQFDDQIIGRVDHQLTTKDHLMARFFYDDFRFQEQTSALPNFYGSDRFLNRNAVVSDTHVFTPNLLMIAAFGYTDTGRQRSGDPATTPQQVGVNVPLASVGAPPQSSISINTYAGFVSGTPITITPKTFEYRTHFTWERGAHMLQFGLDVIRNDEWAWDRSFEEGSWTFDGSRTRSNSVKNSGNPFADFLLGLPVTFYQHGTEPQNIYETKMQPWVQDDWRILPHLTLNLGLRYEPWLPATDRIAPQVGFDAGIQSTVAPFAPKGLLFSGDQGLPHSIFSRDMNAFSPRIGFAWDVSGNATTVVRGAYGIFYRPSPLNLQRFSGNTAAFRSLAETISDPQSFQNPYGSVVGGSPFPWTPVTPSGLKSYVFNLPVTTSALIPHSALSNVQEWNLTVERQLQRDLGVSVAYVGNHMIHGMDSTEGNPAVYIPGVGANGQPLSTEANVNSRRLYQGIATLQILSPFQFSNYNALQVSATKHAENGLTLISNYTWSKCMDNDSSSAGGVTVINKFNINADYAPCDFNVTQLANISVVYDLPNLARFHGLADKMLNHWQVTTITTLQSGGVFNVHSGLDNSLSGPTTNSGENDLADRVPGVSPARPAGVNRVQEYFNTAAYTANALGTFGDSGRNSQIGPAYWDSDIGLLKTFPITERWLFTLRAEGFNAFNHTNFSDPIATHTSPSFGRILSAGPPRVLQFSGRLSF